MKWFKDEDILKHIHYNPNVDRRRVVEGALINICNSLPGNKSFTQEDKQTNKLICQALNLNLTNFIVPQNTVPASSLPAQVADVTDVAEATGTDAVSSPTGAAQEQSTIQTRRSHRLALRTGIT